MDKSTKSNPFDDESIEYIRELLRELEQTYLKTNNKQISVSDRKKCISIDSIEIIIYSIDKQYNTRWEIYSICMSIACLF